MNDKPPRLPGDFWVCPSPGEVAGTSVRVNVAISVEQPFGLQDTDVAGGQSLSIAEASAPGPLPAVRTIGSDAYVLYRYNPDGPAPEPVTVTVSGGSATFDVSLPVG